MQDPYTSVIQGCLANFRRSESAGAISPYLFRNSTFAGSKIIANVGRGGPNRVACAVGDIKDARIVGRNAKSRSHYLSAAPRAQQVLMQSVVKGHRRIISSICSYSESPSTAVAVGGPFRRSMCKYATMTRTPLKEGVFSYPDSRFTISPWRAGAMSAG